ncbi:MAG TPA: hypothetical protein PLA97_12160 [Rubrivivax sp.]|nr:hypothetical protein [Rubrivivax sp.]
MLGRVYEAAGWDQAAVRVHQAQQHFQMGHCPGSRGKRQERLLEEDEPVLDKRRVDARDPTHLAVPRLQAAIAASTSRRASGSNRLRASSGDRPVSVSAAGLLIAIRPRA